MAKLLRAGLQRYTRSPLFWVCMLICVGTGVLLGFGTHNGSFSTFHYLYFLLTNASLVSLLIGREFSDGMFRTKIAVGHPKWKIFLSEAVLALTVTFLMCLIHSALILAFNLKVFDYIDTAGLAFIFVGVLSTALAFSALFVFISCLISKRAIAPVLCILLTVALCFSTFSVTESLSEPKTHDYMVKIEDKNGEQSWESRSEPNPRYVDEPARSMLKWFMKVSPFGQFSSYEDAFGPMFMLPYITETNRPAGSNTYDEFLQTGVYTVDEETVKSLHPLPFYQFGLIFILLGGGCLLFRKKDFR